MNKQPLFILAVCFILGIFFQDKLLLGKGFVDSLKVFCPGILILFFFNSYSLYRARGFLLGVMFFGIGIIAHSYRIFRSESVQGGSKETIVFKIRGKLNSTDKYRRYESIVLVKGNYLNSVIYVPKIKNQLDFDHYYGTKAYMNKLKPPKYDFQFDYAGYLKRKNTEYQFFVADEISSVSRIDLSIQEKIFQKRLEILQRIDKSDLSIRSREFLKGIILADRTEIDSDIIRDFNKSGLVHFLAISGTHIMVIFGMFYFVFRWITPLSFRKFAIISSLLFIWLFAIFIGLGNSVVRSCIMLTVYFTYILLQRKPDVLHSMALSAFIILLIDTQQVFNLGFQLSFIAVLGIFWLNRPILNSFPKQDRYWKKLLFNTISISVSAQLATLPLVLYYFHQFSLISILANCIIVPFSELIITSSFLMVALIACGLDSGIVNMGYDFVINILLESIHLFAGFDSVFFKNISMNGIELLLLFILIYLLRILILKANFKNLMTLIMACLVFFIARTGFDIIENRREEFLIHEIGNDRVFSVKRGDQACFWINSISDKEKIIKYIVDPYSSSRRLRSVEFKSFDAMTKKIMYNGKIYDVN